MEDANKTDRVWTNPNCPFKGKCLPKNIHEATVKNREYIVSLEISLKIRLQQHKNCFDRKNQATALSEFTFLDSIEFSEIKREVLHKTYIA